MSEWIKMYKWPHQKLSHKNLRVHSLAIFENHGPCWETLSCKGFPHSEHRFPAPSSKGKISVLEFELFPLQVSAWSRSEHSASDDNNGPLLCWEPSAVKGSLFSFLVAE